MKIGGDREVTWPGKFDFTRTEHEVSLYLAFKTFILWRISIEWHAFAMHENGNRALSVTLGYNIIFQQKLQNFPMLWYSVWIIKLDVLKVYVKQKTKYTAVKQ